MLLEAAGKYPWEGDLDRMRGRPPRAIGVIVVDSSVWIDHLRDRETGQVARPCAGCSA